MSLLGYVQHARSSSPRLPAYSHDISKLSISVKSNHNFDTIDIGGTLAKVVFTSKNADGDVVLNFAKFDSSDVDGWLSFVDEKLKTIENGELKMTGGGSVKYNERIKAKLQNVTFTHVDEMKSLANGLCFLGTIPEEVFTFNTTSNLIEDHPLLSLDPSTSGDSLFPGVVANIGSGVSFVACKSHSEFTRVGGTPLGGGSYAGLCHMLGGCTSFEEVIKANEEITQNNNEIDNNIDLLVGDIYGSDYGVAGLSAKAVASSFGKAGLNLSDNKSEERKTPSKTDIITKYIINSVTLMTCWNIGQQGGLWAQHVGANHVLFVRNQTNVMKYLALSVGRIGGIKPLFMVHAGFLGVLGAFFA